MSFLTTKDGRAVLKDLFGTANVDVRNDVVVVDDVSHPVVDGVIVLLDETQMPTNLRDGLARTDAEKTDAGKTATFAPDIQATFGAEWIRYDEILPEHALEFRRYFDLVSQDELRGKRVCDLGCGIGRFSAPLVGVADTQILVDFSEAIFVAKRNLAHAERALFFMGDLRNLPFRDDAFDFLFSLGVLHHLPVPCLDEARRLKRLAPDVLLYLYTAFDHRPRYFRTILDGVSVLRRGLSKIESSETRERISQFGARFVYEPLVHIGEEVERRFARGAMVPLWESYRGKSRARIEQDVYDRFFTRIEQRVSRRDIATLADTWDDVEISPAHPYWHFRLRMNAR